ncbi:MAG: AraC family transcriptional regulator, partial [Acinetobacter calcoaceticus]
MIELPNANDWIVRNSDPNSLERIEAFFNDHAYESHRHDTFAIGR